MKQVIDLSVRKIIHTLVQANGSPSIGIMSIGKVLIVYNGVTPLHRYVCSNSKEASKTADRIQAAYDSGYFQKNNLKMM